ncbi:hypothetical protein [Micromonospora sediminimaris]|uniref:hypothetical protein n=1 Tax=Micromonospora sediminimaris TaxID=547162 RepID=UPI0008E2B712|nr:hypothetical protein [Micromonospora sediminimaris]SFC56689.1 hypothetical protein SAMN05216284_105267 [Micromonospora sediminimaris]
MPPRSDPPHPLSRTHDGAGQRVSALLAAAPRHLRVASAADSGAAVTRSHLGDGRCVGWYAPPVPGWRVAIDAERAAAAPPPALARRFGSTDFWGRWTRVECLAKLADVPVATWWHRHGLEVPSGTVWLWRTLPLTDLAVTVAFTPTHRVDRVDRAGRDPRTFPDVAVSGAG